LLRIPRAKTKHEMYGTAVHAALRDLFVQAKERTVPKEFLLNAFRRYLGNEALAQNDFDESLARGRAALSGYYDRYHGDWQTNVITEFSIPGVLLAPDIRLTGRIDKLEFVGSGTEVNVVDYKTGKPKARRGLEEGNEKRQLVFYRVLLDHHEEGKYRMTSADIDFIQPDAKGRYHREHFVISPEEARELAALIMRVGGEILSLSFWDARCGRSECEFCALRDMMQHA
ncbi:MAG: PD-(D/E)XK nuclease family protein, partial [Patescibacteria group bacterium]